MFKSIEYVNVINVNEQNNVQQWKVMKKKDMFDRLFDNEVEMYVRRKLNNEIQLC